MSRRAYLIGICVVSSIYILIFIATQQHRPSESQFSSYNTNVTINNILNAQRQRIKIEMKNFEYPSWQKLSDFVIEKNGNPVRSIIISTWSSGSTFLGDILNSMPGNFYHYEPLLNFEIHRIRGPPSNTWSFNLKKNAINNLLNLLKCDYNNIDYIYSGKNHREFFVHNIRLWSQCKKYPQFCWNSTFLTLFCKLFPLQSMKTVRLQLSLAETLLLDKSLNVRIILLVRDPRGTMQSRKHRLWCPGKPDCDYVPNLCRDLVSDYVAAEYLLKKYPSRFRALRYEDLSLNPYEMTQEILQFYGLPFHPSVKKFLDTHTKLNIGGVGSTRRDSKSAPFHWIKDLTWTEIKRIELSCRTAMSLWGYRQVKNSSNLSPTFDPLIIPPPPPSDNFLEKIFEIFYRN